LPFTFEIFLGFGGLPRHPAQPWLVNKYLPRTPGPGLARRDVFSYTQNFFYLGLLFLQSRCTRPVVAVQSFASTPIIDPVPFCSTCAAMPSVRPDRKIAACPQTVPPPLAPGKKPNGTRPGPFKPASSIAGSLPSAPRGRVLVGGTCTPRPYTDRPRCFTLPNPRSFQPPAPQLSPILVPVVVPPFRQGGRVRVATDPKTRWVFFPKLTPPCSVLPSFPEGGPCPPRLGDPLLPHPDPALLFPPYSFFPQGGARGFEFCHFFSSCDDGQGLRFLVFSFVF